MNIGANEQFGVFNTELSVSAHQILSEVTSDFPDDLRVGNEASALDWLEKRGHEVRDDLFEADELSMHTLRSVVAGDSGYAATVIALGNVETEIPATPSDYIHTAYNALYPPDLKRGILLGAVGLHGYGFVAQQGGISPDMLALLYFRNHERVSTPVTTFNVTEIGSDLADLLKQPRFIIPTSSAHSTQEIIKGRLSVLYGPNSSNVRFNVPLMTSERGLSLHGPEEQEAILAFSAHLGTRAVHLTMDSGDMLLINNRRALHGKGEQSKFVTPELSRWQRRLAVAVNLDRLEPYYNSEGSRVVESDRYLKAVA